MKNHTADVVIVGGGIIGCSIAWELAAEGLEIVLVERDQPGAGASPAAAGILIPEASPDVSPAGTTLHRQGLQLYPDYLERLANCTGLPVEYRKAGRLVLALTEQELVALEKQQQVQAAAGITAEMWDPTAIREAEPAVIDACGGLYFPDHALVDNARLMTTVAMAAGRRGVKILSENPATGLGIERGRITGIQLAAERITANIVINAAGSWSGLVDQRAWLPVRPAKGQMIAFETRPPPIHHIVGSSYCSFTPRADGRLLCGAAGEAVGYDTKVTAGALWELLRGALTLIPTLRECPLDSMWAGLRPRCTVDSAPIIGPDPRFQGLYHATGHF